MFSDSLDLLFRHARSDTGGSKRCAQFLLSLWKGDFFKADLQDLLYTDTEFNQAILRAFYYLHERYHQLSTHIDREQMLPIIDAWGDDFRVKNH